ncbi:hypothetical protein [Natrinema versiforme]|uniref:GAPS4 PD-(D/E)XK nuclease domain-containing protein n=1 Tax=Natrinema versiforme TaxID=88724 RepID=A0A4P8WK49_9EURY|nr:hypothetical protein [Natrinema versiforme]QCS43888.1 hypothetical protein FEJ81_16610 [Natrinema versiforme]
MPEDGNEHGEVANKRLLALFENLGWTRQGKANLDIPCTSGIHRDRNNDHGVDGYMTYDDPFRSLERGVFIESKFRQWESVRESNLDDYMKQVLGTMECAPEADEFQTRLNFHEDRNWDAGIIGVWSEDEFHRSEFQDELSGVNVRGKERGTYEIAVLGNYHLNRLSHLASEYNGIKKEYNSEGDRLYFYYPSMIDKPYPTEQNALSLEYALSDIIFARLEAPYTVRGEVDGRDEYNIIFYFGTVSVDSLRILFNLLVEYNMLDSKEVWIYHDMMCHDGDMQDLETAKSQFKRNVVPDEEDSSKEEVPKFRFYRMTEASFDSYTDRLMEE